MTWLRPRYSCNKCFNLQRFHFKFQSFHVSQYSVSSQLHFSQGDYCELFKHSIQVYNCWFTILILIILKWVKWIPRETWNHLLKKRIFPLNKCVEVSEEFGFQISILIKLKLEFQMEVVEKLQNKVEILIESIDPMT